MIRRSELFSRSNHSSSRLPSLGATPSRWVLDAVTKSYVLAMMMLALAASGVVWIAVKERPMAPPSKTAVAEPRATMTIASASSTPVSAPEPTQSAPSPSTTASTRAEDAGGGGASGPTFPPLAPYAAWSVVRWDMSAAEAEGALKKEGVIVAEEMDEKTGGKRLRANAGASEATIDFGARGATEIVVTVTNLSKDGAHAIVAKTKERAPATKTIDRSERRWKKDGGATASFVTYGDGTTATAREEHTRESAPGGAVGFAGLRWGMSTQEVVGQLTAAGHVAHVVQATAATLDPCAVPNPSLDCAKKSRGASVPFSKGDVEGTASFNQFGLRHVELSGPTVDGGAARAKELESSLGKPASVEVSTKTLHVDHARLTAIDVELKERPPAAGFAVVETYRPKN